MILTVLKGLWGQGFAFGLFGPLLLTGLMQTAATCTNPDTVTRLVESDGVVYAFDLTENPLVRMNLIAHYDASLNGWERVVEAPEAVFETAATPVSLPITACLPDDPSTCYRIEDEGRVLESDDGGQRWRTAWKIPAGRRQFMERTPNVCEGMGPYDLLVTGTGSDHRIFAAFGHDGVVTGDENGNWQRQQVGSARPTPFRASTLLEILATIPAELFSWLLFVFIFGVGQYLFFLRRLRLILTPLTWAVLIAFSGSLLLLYALVTGAGLLDWGLLLLIAILYTVPVYLAYRKWRGESYSHMDDSEKGMQAGRIWMASTVGLVAGGMLILSLWPIGILPFYWLMVLAILALAVGVGVWGSLRIQSLMAGAGAWQ